MPRANVHRAIVKTEKEIASLEVKREFFQDMANESRERNAHLADLQQIVADQEAAVLKIKREYLQRFLDLQRKQEALEVKRARNNALQITIKYLYSRLINSENLRLR